MAYQDAQTAYKQEDSAYKSGKVCQLLLAEGSPKTALIY
jgi:hypothetical protein